MALCGRLLPVDGAVIPAGDECIIEKIEGVTLIVKEMDASEN